MNNVPTKTHASGHAVWAIVLLLTSLALPTLGALWCHASWVKLAIPLALSVFVPLFVFRCMQLYNRQMYIVLIAASILFQLGAVLNVHTWIACSCSLEHPLLFYDYHRDFTDACALAAGQPVSLNYYPGYVNILGWIFRIAGCNVVIPVAVNICLALFSAMMAGKVTELLVKTDDGKYSISAMGAAIPTAVAGFALAACVILKDMSVTFSFTCVALGVAYSLAGRFGIRSMVSIAFGALLLLLIKPQMGVFILAGAVVMASRRNMRAAVFTALIAFAVCMGGDAIYPPAQSARPLSDVMRISLLDTDGVSSYGAIMSDYYIMPLWKRIIYLPFTMSVQSILPLPWHFIRDMKLGAFFAYGHVTLMWYAVLFLLTVYYIFIMWRHSTASMIRWSLWWLSCYAGVALYSCGTSARYVVPFLPMAAPIAAMSFAALRAGTVGRRWMVWLTVYSILLLCALTATWFFMGGDF